jgi:hypothetical protein
MKKLAMKMGSGFASGFVAVRVPEAENVDNASGFVDAINDSVDAEGEDFASMQLMKRFDPAAFPRLRARGKFRFSIVGEIPVVFLSAPSLASLRPIIDDFVKVGLGSGR